MKKVCMVLFLILNNQANGTECPWVKDPDYSYSKEVKLLYGKSIYTYNKEHELQEVQFLDQNGRVRYKHSYCNFLMATFIYNQNGKLRKRYVYYNSGKIHTVLENKENGDQVNIEYDANGVEIKDNKPCKISSVHLTSRSSTFSASRFTGQSQPALLRSIAPVSACRLAPR